MSGNDHEASSSAAPSIKDILSDEDLALLFREFLHQLHSAENLSFYVEAQDYRTLETSEDRSGRAEKMWGKYFAQTAQTPLNVDSKVKERISNDLLDPPASLFDEAAEFAYSLLAYDCYRKFISSDTYQKWLASEAKKKSKWGLLFPKKKSIEKPSASLHKTESMLLLQKHVATQSHVKK